MSSVTKSHLSVDTNLSLFSFLSNTYHIYVFLPGDSDKSDKRVQRLKQQGLQRGDKRKQPVTKGSETTVSILMMGFCHRVFLHVDGLRGPCLKALRLLSLLSLSPEGKGQKDGWWAVKNAGVSGSSRGFPRKGN